MKHLIPVDADCYQSIDGEFVMKREVGLSPNGNQFGGRWVLRHNGEFIDYDQYRFDLAAKYRFTV